MVRSLIFGGIAASLAVAYLFVASQLASVGGPAPGEPTPVPTLPPERTDAPRVPGAITFVLRGDVYVLRDGRYAPLSSEGRSAEPDLSDDGATLLYTRRETIDGRSIVDGQVVNARLGYTVVVQKPSAGGEEDLVLDGLRVESTDGFHQVWWYSGPALDPEGERIAVIAAAQGASADLHVVTLPTGRGVPAVLLLSQGAELADPAWSPDGTAIAVTSYNTAVPGILIWDAERPGVAERLELPEGEAYRPSFSPDGEWILYTLRRDGRSDLHAFELASGTDVELTSDGRSWNGTFSPDGEWVAFLSEREGTVDLYAMEIGDALGGGGPKEALKLTRGEGVDAESRPSWGR
ncbi:MAG: TolB family protein [Candidatus Limnocylindria bacterium]